MKQPLNTLKYHPRSIQQTAQGIRNTCSHVYVDWFHWKTFYQHEAEFMFHIHNPCPPSYTVIHVLLNYSLTLRSCISVQLQQSNSVETAQFQTRDLTFLAVTLDNCGAVMGVEGAGGALPSNHILTQECTYLKCWSCISCRGNWGVLQKKGEGRNAQEKFKRTRKYHFRWSHTTLFLNR